MGTTRLVRGPHPRLRIGARVTADRRERIAASFGAAARYDEHAVAQRHAAGHLVARIAALPLGPAPRILEVGCGTGMLASLRPASLAGADWLMTDLSPAMVVRCRARFEHAEGVRFAVLDGEEPRLDPPEAPFDLVVSNFALQWFADGAGALAAWFRLIRPGGHLLVATLARETFSEWRSAHEALGLTAGTPRFPEFDQLRSLVIDGVSPAVERELFLERHESARAFLRAVKAIGAGTPAPLHRPLSPAQLRAVMGAFEAAGAVARYEIVYLHLAKPGAPS